MHQWSDQEPEYWQAKATGNGALQRSARNAGVHILEVSLAVLNGKSVYDWMILLM